MGWNNGIDFDLLAAAGVMRVAETSCVSLSQFGLGRNFRRAVQGGQIRVLDHSETTAIDVFRGRGAGCSFHPDAGSSLVIRPSRRPSPFPGYRKPFHGRQVVLVEPSGPTQPSCTCTWRTATGMSYSTPNGGTTLLSTSTSAARPKRVIVTVEQIVSEDFVLNNPELTVLPRRYVDAVVEVPFGAHPCMCDSRYAYDTRFLKEYVEASADELAMKEFIESWVEISEPEYLERLGPMRLQGLSHALSAELTGVMRSE